jgi:hypothetical protein
MVVVALEERVMLPLYQLLVIPSAEANACCSDDADTLLLRAAMVVVALEEKLILPLSAVLTPRAVVCECSDDADTLLLRAAMVVVALEERAIMPLQ